MEPRIAEIIAVAIVLLAVLRGAGKGLVLTLFSMVRIVLLLIVTMILAPILEPILPASWVAREGIAFLIALVVSGIALSIIAGLLQVVNHIPVVSTVNHIGGAVVGFVWGLIIVWVALLLIGVFQDAQWCHQASEYVRQSQILMQIQKFNPLPAILKNFNFPVI